MSPRFIPCSTGSKNGGGFAAAGWKRPGNAGGVALYAKSGFRTVGIYHEQGQLDGKWVDTIVMEKLLSA